MNMLMTALRYLTAFLQGFIYSPLKVFVYNHFQLCHQYCIYSTPGSDQVLFLLDAALPELTIEVHLVLFVLQSGFICFKHA